VLRQLEFQVFNRFAYHDKEEVVSVFVCVFRAPLSVLGHAPTGWRIHQHFNRRHKLVGHVLQGRCKAILPEENYLLELARYIVLNPVRALFYGRPPDDWYWVVTLLLDDAAPHVG
jgi:hypothetical protein